MVARNLCSEDVSSIALVNRAAAEGVATLEKGIGLRVDGGAPTSSRHLPTFASRRVHTILVTSAAASDLPVPSEGDQQHEMWRSLDVSVRPALWAGLLRRLAVNRLELTAAGTAHRLLRLDLPSMACSTRDLEHVLGRVGVLQLFSAVAFDRGLCILDGALVNHLTRANTTAALLLPVLQSPAVYGVLEDLAVQVSSSGEVQELVEALSAGRGRAVPQLKSLALAAEPGDDVEAIRADLSALEHPRITQLTLNSIELTGGLASLAHMTGLQSLAVYYEEDRGPPLNLGGDVASLAPLRQLCCLALHNLASSEGLSRLRRLHSLSLAPQPGSCLALAGLPHLHSLALDLSSCGSSGRELLRRRSVAHMPPAGHGLDALRCVELRCFVWGTPPAAAAGADAEGQGEEPQQQQGEAAGADAGAAAEEEAEGAGSDGEEEDGWAEEDDEVAAEAEAMDAAQAAPDDEAEEEAESSDGEEEDDSEEEEEEGWDAAPGGEERPADALARLERCYLAALLGRLPGLTSIAFPDYLGVVGAPSSKGGPTTRAAAAAAAGCTNSATATNGAWQDTVVTTIAGAAWQRAVVQVPAAPGGAGGGASQTVDIRYVRL